MAISDIQWIEKNSEFGYHEINHHTTTYEKDQLAHEIDFEFETIDQKITLKEKSKINQSTGLALWTCSQILFGYLVENAHFVNGQRVLELGAGLGLCGIVAHYLNAKRVVATDGDVTVLENLRYNYKLNNLKLEEDGKDDITSLDNVGTCKPSIVCPQLIWGKDLQKFQNEYGRHSVIMGTDIFYADESVQPIWETIDILLEEDGVFMLAYCPHKVTIDQILNKAKQLGFTWLKPNISQYSDEYSDQE